MMDTESNNGGNQKYKAKYKVQFWDFFDNKRYRATGIVEAESTAEAIKLLSDYYLDLCNEEADFDSISLEWMDDYNYTSSITELTNKEVCR